MTKKITLILVFIFIVIISITSSLANGINYNVYKPQSYSASNISIPKEQVLFILDCSNSMNENLGEKTKIKMAVHTLSQLLPRLSSEIAVGLRVYGHKNGFLPAQSCTASELVTPISQSNASAVQNRLSTLVARGWTPITYSLKQAVSYDFAGYVGPKRIILLSDGGENCDESPCDYAIDLMSRRDDIKIDVIAFNIDDEEANNQLKCVALATSGKFHSANTSAELMNSLMDSMNIEKDVQGFVIKK